MSISAEQERKSRKVSQSSSEMFQRLRGMSKKNTSRPVVEKAGRQKKKDIDSKGKV